MSGAGWEVGDLALCVDLANLGGAHCRGSSPTTPAVLGGVYTVTGVCVNNQGKVGLLLENEQPHTCLCCLGHSGWHPPRFRKILPDAHEDCEPEFVTLLNRIKRPAKQGVSA